MSELPPSAAQRVSSPRRCRVRVRGGGALSLHLGKEGRHPSFLHPSFLPVPSPSTGGAPGPAPAFREIRILFDEER